MSAIEDRAEQLILGLERPQRDRRSAWIGAASAVVHAALVGVLLIGQLAFEREREKDEPTLPLVFEDLVQPPPAAPRAPRVPLDIRQPPPPPPPPPREEPDGALLGWNSQGAERGTPTRPPGPETGAFGEDRPGPKGEGMKDAGDEAAEPAPVTPPAPQAPEQAPADAGQGAALGAPEPLPEGDDLPRPRRGGAPRGSEAPPPMRVPAPSGEGRQRGSRGSGIDFDIGGGGGAFGDLQFESTDYNWSEYSSKVYWAVYRAWLRELHGRTARFERDQALLNLPDLDGEVYIRVTLHRDGTIDTEVLRPSAVPSLDEASVAGLRRAVLPPLPSDFPRDHERVTWRFRIEGFASARQLQRTLDMAQMRGTF